MANETGSLKKKCRKNHTVTITGDMLESNSVGSSYQARCPECNSIVHCTVSQVRKAFGFDKEESTQLLKQLYEQRKSGRASRKVVMNEEFELHEPVCEETPEEPEVDETPIFTPVKKTPAKKKRELEIVSDNGFDNLSEPTPTRPSRLESFSHIAKERSPAEILKGVILEANLSESETYRIFRFIDLNPDKIVQPGVVKMLLKELGIGEQKAMAMANLYQLDLQLEMQERQKEANMMNLLVEPGGMVNFPPITPREETDVYGNPVRRQQQQYQPQPVFNPMPLTQNPQPSGSAVTPEMLQQFQNNIFMQMQNMMLSQRAEQFKREEESSVQKQIQRIEQQIGALASSIRSIGSSPPQPPPASTDKDIIRMIIDSQQKNNDTGQQDAINRQFDMMRELFEERLNRKEDLDNLAGVMMQKLEEVKKASGSPGSYPRSIEEWQQAISMAETQGNLEIKRRELQDKRESRQSLERQIGGAIKNVGEAIGQGVATFLVQRQGGAQPVAQSVPSYNMQDGTELLKCPFCNQDIVVPLNQEYVRCPNPQCPTKGQWLKRMSPEEAVEQYRQEEAELESEIGQEQEREQEQEETEYTLPPMGNLD
jgi:uncharacterized C2H2 Zn-finger protein